MFQAWEEGGEFLTNIVSDPSMALCITPHAIIASQTHTCASSAASQFWAGFFCGQGSSEVVVTYSVES